MTTYEEIKISIQKGDVISSKKGFLLSNSPLRKKDYLVFKLEYLGDGKWENIGDKFEVISKKIR